MFAAAATVAKMFLDVSIHAAKWIAQKTLIVAVLAIVLPWVLREAMYWGFEYITVYGRSMAEQIMGYLNTLIGSAGVEVNIHLTGVGGYLAIQTGLIEYSSIIFTGWGLYWVVAVLAKTPTRI